MKVHNKLIRDKIPEIMINSGAIPVTRILNDDEYKRELDRKLQEEITEYLESDDVVELADIEEVLLAILKFKQVSYQEFEGIRREKVLKRGAFDNRVFLEKEE